MVRAVDLGKAVNTGRPALQSEGACVRLSRSRPGGVCACVCAHVCMCVRACVRFTHTACVGAMSLVIARTGALVAAADGCEPAVKQGRGPAGGSGRDFVVALSVSVTPLLPPAFAPFTPWQPFLWPCPVFPLSIVLNTAAAGVPTAPCLRFTWLSFMGEALEAGLEGESVTECHRAFPQGRGISTPAAVQAAFPSRVLATPVTCDGGTRRLPVPVRVAWHNSGRTVCHLWFFFSNI